MIERHVFKVERARTRAIELYRKDSPFRHRTERNRARYNRKQKHRNEWSD